MRETSGKISGRARRHRGGACFSGYDRHRGGARGSECNGGAVITNEEKKVKTGRDYPQLNPAFALLDPVYTYSVPKGQMISGSFDILSHILETYFSEPDEDNVSDDIMEALMRSVIRNLRAAIQNPEDYTARSNLMWDATMAENRIIKMGKKCDFECHNMEHQLGAYTDWQPRLRPGGAAPRLLPPHLPRGAAKVRPLCRERLGHRPPGPQRRGARPGRHRRPGRLHSGGRPAHHPQGAGRPNGNSSGEIADLLPASRREATSA